MGVLGDSQQTQHRVDIANLQMPDRVCALPVLQEVEKLKVTKQPSLKSFTGDINVTALLRELQQLYSKVSRTAASLNQSVMVVGQCLRHVRPCMLDLGPELNLNEPPILANDQVKSPVTGPGIDAVVLHPNHVQHLMQMPVHMLQVAQVWNSEPATSDVLHLRQGRDFAA